jgi:hypothetical protein
VRVNNTKANGLAQNESYKMLFNHRSIILMRIVDQSAIVDI